MFNYVNVLLQETDGLEENIKKLDEKIEEYELLAEKNEAEKQRKVSI